MTKIQLFFNGLDHFLPETLTDRIQNGPPLRVKYGADPSAPDLHLGHWVGLKKLRLLQDLGHTILFLIGDFTAKIGDPTGKSETRKPLTEAQVRANTVTYQEQVFKVLNPTKTEIVFNSDWLSKLTTAELVTLASKTTVARMLERDDFQKRYTSGRPIGLHEFLYPLFQGYDSVHLKSDLELCGTDQTFNVLMGRQLQKESGQAPQAIAVTPLLEGLDGVQKMSKSLGNTIGLLDSAEQMFGKLMSIPDALILRYLQLLADFSPEQLENAKQRLTTENPKFIKQELALNVVTQLHNATAAQSALAQFEQVFSKKQLPDEMPSLALPSGEFRLDDFIVSAQIIASKKEVHRLAAQGAITLDGESVSDIRTPILPESGTVLKIGKLKYFRLDTHEA